MSRKKESKELELFGAPNSQYEKFFAKFQEIDSLKTEEWKVPHILGYFCKKYKETYNTDYQFKFNSPSPTKSFEVFQIKKLASILTANPKLLKEYIDWVYLNKVVKAKRKLTSISFMTHEGLVNDYKFNVLLAGKKNLNIDRSTALPEIIKTIFNDAGVSISNYGDLAFLSQMTDKPQLVEDAFSKAEANGLDKDVLRRIV